MASEPVLLNIDPRLVDIPADRLRWVDPNKVTELAASFEQIGQLQPIEVFASKTQGRYTLNIGAHRVTAARQAGLTTIMAVVFEGSSDALRLHEIDENLYRAELSPFDQAAFLAERRVIYERMNGPVKPGRRSKRAIATNLSQLSFFDDVTAKFALPRRMIQRALTRKSRISEEVWRRLRGHPVTKIATELDKLARLNEAEQRKVVRLLMQETHPAKSVSAALRAMSDAPVESPHDRQMRRLHEAWDKARPQAKAEFLAYLAAKENIRQTDAA